MITHLARVTILGAVLLGVAVSATAETASDVPRPAVEVESCTGPDARCHPSAGWSAVGARETVGPAADGSP